MKTKLLAAMVMACLILCYACSKDKAQKAQAITCNGINVDSNTYNLRIKAIIDGNCADPNTPGCHDLAWYSGALNVPLYDYPTTINSFQTKNVFCSLNRQSGCFAMPRDKPKLADSLIAYLQCWADNGYRQ
jgi:hypothetical protein